MAEISNPSLMILSTTFPALPDVKRCGLITQQLQLLYRAVADKGELPPKKNSSSLLAERGESDPCTALNVASVPNLPLILLGASCFAF